MASEQVWASAAGFNHTGPTPEARVYVDLGTALLDIELHRPYRTIFGLWRCEWCMERCKRPGCETRLAAMSYFNKHASRRDREWYSHGPHAGLFSETEVHSVINLAPAKASAPAVSAQRPLSPLEQRPGGHRWKRGRRPSPRPHTDHPREYPIESRAQVGA
jgi:hypothetical protein